jgi:putative protease
VPAARLAIVAHHRIPTFHTEHCVYSHLLSNGRDFRTCGRPCERHAVALRDHLGREHPVIVDVGCRNTVFHHAPQQSAAWIERLVSRGAAVPRRVRPRERSGSHRGAGRVARAARGPNWTPRASRAGRGQAASWASPWAACDS